jgi:hypothetical protein
VNSVQIKSLSVQTLHQLVVEVPSELVAILSEMDPGFKEVFSRQGQSNSFRGQRHGQHTDRALTRRHDGWMLDPITGLCG